MSRAQTCYYGSGYCSHTCLYPSRGYGGPLPIHPSGHFGFLALSVDAPRSPLAQSTGVSLEAIHLNTSTARPHLKCTIFDHPVHCLINSGADISALNRQTFSAVTTANPAHSKTFQTSKQSRPYTANRYPFMEKFPSPLNSQTSQPFSTISSF